MSFWLLFRFVIGMIFILASLVLFCIQIMGVFKMNYVLNRMHSAAIGDAMALVLAFIGIIILNGLNFTTFKLFLVPCFMFFSSPVSSHLIARMEAETTDRSDKFRMVNVRELDDLVEKEEK